MELGRRFFRPPQLILVSVLSCSLMRLFLRNLILAALALAILLKVYMWYRVDTAVERLAGLLLPLGTLSHSEVAASFSGDVTISDLRFIPNAADDGGYFSTNELILHTPGLHYLLGLGGTLGEGLFPESMGVTMDGLQLGSEGGPSGAGMSVSGNPFEALGCGSVDFFAPHDLQSMGYSLLTPKIRAAYAVLPDNNSLELSFEASTRRVSSIRLNADLSVAGLTTVTFQNEAPAMELVGFTFEYRDAAFNERRNEYCAELNNVTESSYLDEHLEQLRLALAQRRIGPGDAFLSRYRQLMAPGAHLEVWGNPTQPVSVAGLTAMAPEQLMEALGLTVNVNGQSMDSPDLAFNVAPLAEPVADADAPAATSAPVTARPSSSATRPDPSRSLRDTALENIGSYVGNQVVINTITGRLYQGYVDEVSPDGRIMLTITRRGGSAKVPINIDQIERLRVFR